MPIEFTCPHCESLLRVEDANAGKRARCPHCGMINRIPGEIVDTTPAPPVSQQFFIDSVSGQTYGPITKKELDAWVDEGRVSATCTIRATGQPNGQPASLYYPSLIEKLPASKFGSATESANLAPVSSAQKQTNYNPYVAPTSTPEKQADFHATETSGISPIRIDLGEVFTFAYQIFVRNMGLLVAASVVCLVPQILSNLIRAAFENGRGDMGPIAAATMLVLYLIQIYLVIGQTRISLRLVRGQPVEFSDLFKGGDKFLPIVGFSLLIIIPVFCGFILLIIPGVFLLLYFWPSYSLIIDYKANVFDSFGVAYRIGEVNLLNSFVLGLASFGIACLGAMMCGVGLIFASGYISVLWAASYLMMSGQIAIRPNQ